MRYALRYPVAWLNDVLMSRWGLAFGRKNGKRRIVRTGL